MITSYANIPTSEAQNLVLGACQDWSRTFPVQHEDQWGEVKLPMGVCCLYAGNVLKVVLESDPEQMPAMQQVVADYLKRIAANSAQELVIHWE